MTKQDKTTDASGADRDGTHPDLAADVHAPPRPQTKANRTKANRIKANRTEAERRATIPSDTATVEVAETTSLPAARGRQISLTFTTAGLAKVLGALVVVGALVGLTLLGWGHHRQSAELAAFDASRSASEQFVTGLVGAMTKDGVADMKNVLGPLSTGDFQKHLEQQQSDTAAAVTQLNLQDAQSTVKSVSVERFDADTARTSVLVEVSGTSALAPEGGKSLMLLWLDLRKEDGKWLVAQVSGAQAGIGPEQGGPSSVRPTPPTSTPPTPTPPAPAAPAPAPSG